MTSRPASTSTPATSSGASRAPTKRSQTDGDTIIISAGGNLNAGDHTATGSGTFEHRAPDGTLLGSGTFTVIGLSAFQFYGCGEAGGEPIPENLCGGRALLPIHIIGHPAGGGTVELDGVLTVDCLVGNPPPGHHEGVKVNVKDLIDFNKSVEGETVFVQQ